MTLVARGRWAVDATLRSYSLVLFSRSRRAGLLLLLATLLSPEVGVAGLVGAVLSWAAALALGFERADIAAGRLSYNGLLTGLVVGAFYEPTWALLAVGSLGAILAVLVHVGLAGVLRYHLDLPVLSLPFVLVTWVLLAALPHVGGAAPRATAVGALIPGELCLPWLDGLLDALGAIFALPLWPVGALVWVALLSWSRIAAVHAILGGLAWLGASALLVDQPLGATDAVLGFNAILTAIALGGVFFVPGRASAALAVLGGLAATLLGVAAGRALGVAGLPVLALPFNLAVLAGIYALRQRRAGAVPWVAVLTGRSPEETLHWHQVRVLRFGQLLPVRLTLPFRGRWVCTQGHGGEHTHRGRWRHGLDFEVAGPDGLRHGGEGDTLADWHCHGLPVCAAADGVVARVVDGLPEGEVGEADTHNPWGNAVVVRHAAGLHSVVAHLRPGSTRVREGDRVSAGDELGRCGASGRAPVPHLHFQLQVSDVLGDSTLPVRFHGVVAEGEGGPQVRDAVVPEEGQTLRPLVRDEELASAVRWRPGTRLTATVQAGGRERHTELEAGLGLLGERTLVEPSTGARLWFEHTGASLVVLDHDGPRDGPLFALYCGLPRLPLEEGPLEWTDHLNERRLRSSPARWILDLASALRAPAARTVRYRSHPDRGRAVVRGEGGLASEVVLDGGLSTARVEVDGREILVRFGPGGR